MKYIFVNGYGCTGSSAVVDYLKEFDNVEVPAAEKEFRLLKDPYGIIDLDYSLNHSTDPLNEDIALKKFIWMAKKYISRPNRLSDIRCGYIDDFGENIRIQTNKYISSLIDTSYDGYWWYMDMEKPAYIIFIKKLLKKLKLKDFETYEKICLYTLTESQFLKLTREYLYNIFSPLVKDEVNNFVVLDNAIPATHPSYAERYFQNYKMINVERDPRDIYANLYKKGLLIGYYSSKTDDPSLFVKWYRKMRRNQECSPNVKTIWFEDFCRNYDKVCDELCSFLGLKHDNHKLKKQFFNPEYSIKDVELWKKFANQKEIEYIAENLSDCLYKDQ